MEELFYKIFSDIPRLGPGDTHSTLKAIQAIKEIPDNPKILDVGCGTGMQTIELIKHFGSKIVAVDNHSPYLEKLNSEAQRKGFEDQILCLNANMLDSDFVQEKYDLIWAEGSIYIIGIKKGLETFCDLLKSKGHIAATEVSWLKPNPPQDLIDYWNQEYPSITTIEQNLKTIQSLGFKLINYFTLPESSWWDNFYNPLEKRLSAFRAEYHENMDALELIDFIQLEIDMFRKYSEYFGYVFYIVQKK